MSIRSDGAFSRFTRYFEKHAYVFFMISEEIQLSKYDNQEAFILSAKRVKARIARAKELEVDSLDHEGLLELVERLSLAKAIQAEKAITVVRRGQEYYVQTLVDAVTKSVETLVDAEYAQATMELGTEDDIMESLTALQAA